MSHWDFFFTSSIALLLEQAFTDTKMTGEATNIGKKKSLDFGKQAKRGPFYGTAFLISLNI